jgi:hypothetical protein
MKHTYQVFQAPAIYRDEISIRDVFPNIEIPELCTKGKDVYFLIHFESGEKIQKGDILISILFYDSTETQIRQGLPIKTYDIKSEFEGYLAHGFIPIQKPRTIDELSEPITIYSQLDDFLEDTFPTKYDIYKDVFSLDPIINWISVAGYNKFDCLIGFHLNSLTFIVFSIDRGSPTMLLVFNKHERLIRKQDTITFKFEDGSLSHYPILMSPVCYKNESLLSASLPIHFSDIDKFSKTRWTMLRIEHADGRPPIVLKNEYPEVYCEEYSRELFKQYTNKFIQALSEIGIKPIDISNDMANTHSSVKVSREECFVYLMIDTANGFHKIGISNHPEFRERTLQSEKPSIEKVCAKKYPSRLIAQSIESALHKTFASKRIRGEWFNLSKNDVAQIIETLS